MAEGAPSDPNGLSPYSRVPQGRTVRLDDQIRQCAASVAANIAEGCGKRGNAEFQRFLNISSGSASEHEYHVLLARDLKFLAEADYNKLHAEVVEVKRMRAALVRRIEQERLAG